MILGNKCDLEESRVVTRERGQMLAAEHSIKFYETSAKSGLNVEEAFLTLARDIKDKMDKPVRKGRGGVGGEGGEGGEGRGGVGGEGGERRGGRGGRGEEGWEGREGRGGVGGAAWCWEDVLSGSFSAQSLLCDLCPPLSGPHCRMLPLKVTTMCESKTAGERRRRREGAVNTSRECRRVSCIV